MVQKNWIANSRIHFVSFVDKLILFLMFLFCFCLNSANVAAAEIAVSNLADYGNVSVLEISGGFDAKNPDGSVNSAAREAVVKEFFKTHRDEYDFLVFFTNFDYTMPSEGAAKAFYLGVRNDTHGIGKDLFDNSAAFGSNSRLQGTIDMGDLTALASDPLDPNFNETLYVLSHELMHRWGAKGTFKSADGSISQSLLGKDKDHWSFLLDSRGSVMYGNQWQDNGNGTFTSTTPQNQMKYYSPLDLYLAGLIDKSKVPSMLLIESPGIDPARLPESGVTVIGTARNVTIDDIIAAMGPRVPDTTTSPKTFKTAFLYLVRPGTFAPQDIYAIENIRNGFVTRHSILTDGASIVEAAALPKDDVPTNPGILPPPITPRSTPANIDDAIAWLIAAQQQDGSWRDLVQTSERDTAAAVSVLQGFPAAQAAVQAGQTWMAATQSANTDFLCRRIEAGVAAGQDVSGLVQELLSRKNSDNGWGSDRTYGSNAADTGLALKALATAGSGDQQVIAQAIQYLKGKQKQDGGWTGNGESTIQATANVLSAFGKFRTAYQLDDAIAKAVAWLLSKQNIDGGFGNSPSTVYDTAVAMLALFDGNAAGTATANALQYIVSRQDKNGSWNQSVFETSLAAAAMLKALVDPDLSIKSADITFIPAQLRSLPSPVVINASVENIGRTAATAKVVLYDGDPSSGKIIGEQTLTFPGQSATVVTFPSEVKDGSERRYTVVVDPDNAVKEPNEGNNSASRTLQAEATYEFEVLAAEVTVSPATVDQFQDMKITATVRNKGTTTGYNVQLKFFIDDPATPADIATLTIDTLPAGGSITREVTWRANKAGANLPLAVQADPLGNFAEVSEENNKASVPVTVNAVVYTDPNITISYKDIAVTPSPVNQGGTARLSAVVKNEGVAAANDITVTFHRGVPGDDGLLLNSTVIQQLAPNESATVTAEWADIQESGEKIIFVQADYAGAEIRKDDNSAFVTLDVLSYPDVSITSDLIEFQPAAPKEGDNVDIIATLFNSGGQDAVNVPVAAYDGEALIAETVVDRVPGKNERIIRIAFDTSGRTGSRNIVIIVNPAQDPAIEVDASNNRASRPLSVFDGTHWLSTTYLSPNNDGVQDNAKLFYRFDQPATVRAEVVDAEGAAVRSFEASGTPQSEGSFSWDGKQDNGTVADDGEYRFRILDSAGNVLKSASVVVDTNRSFLLEAAASGYLQFDELSKRVPSDDTRLSWLPDESGILLCYIYNESNPDKLLNYGVSSGLYMMSPDGMEMQRIVPLEWSAENDPVYRYYYDYSISPTSDRIAVYVLKRNKDWRKSYDSSEQLMLMNPDGSGMAVVDAGATFYLWNFLNNSAKGWSPDGQYILYETYDGYQRYLWAVRSDGTGKSLVVSTTGYIDFFNWSTDGRKLLYATYKPRNNGYSTTYALNIADMSGGRREIAKIDDLMQVAWALNNTRLLVEYDLCGPVSCSQHVVSVDAESGGTIKELATGTTGDYVNLYPAPEGRSFMITRDRGYRKPMPLEVYDIDGGQIVQYEDSDIYDVRWSTDGTKIIYLAEKLRDNENVADVMVVDIAKAAVNKVFTRYWGWVDAVWLEDDETLLYSDLYNQCYVNVRTEKAGPLTFDARPSNWEYFRGVAPAGRHMTYVYLNGVYDRRVGVISSFLNLPVELRATREKSDVLLTGTAEDRNFAGYSIEYADAAHPEKWNLIAPPKEAPVRNGTFGKWVPPAPGTYKVRLTGWDKAGNRAESIKSVSWGQFSSISDIYQSVDTISPNGDGVRESVDVHYRVNEPVNLDFTIYDDNNDPVNSIEMNHLETGSYVVSWDGRDGSGSVVPDGRYRIKVLNSELYVTVDTTPPDVRVVPGTIYQKKDGEVLQGLAFDVNAHARDEGIKEWVVSRGAGEDPREWIEIASGSGSLGSAVPESGQAAGGTQDSVARSFGQDEVTGLAGNKFRITGEDGAGNRSAFISGFVPEQIVFHAWDDSPIDIAPAEGQPAPVLSGPFGVHSLRIAETIRRSLSRLVVQYEQTGIWTDGRTIESPADGDVLVQWDNSLLSSDIDHLVRVKAVDDGGNEYFSNAGVLRHAETFELSLICDAVKKLVITNGLNSPLQMLKVERAPAAQKTVWSDFAVFDANRGDAIPGRGFILDDAGGQIKNGDLLRMTGTTVAGTVRQSNIVDGYCDVKLELMFTPRLEGCNTPVRTVTVAAKVTEGQWLIGAAPETALDITIFMKDGTTKVHHADGAEVFAGLGGSMDLDIGNLIEGGYAVDAALTYLNPSDNSIKTVRDHQTLTVDHSVPQVSLLSPAADQKACPVRMGDRFGIPLQALVHDNFPVVGKRQMSTALSYTPCEILGSIECTAKDSSGDIVKHGTIDGMLATWDVTNKRGSNYLLKMKTTDPMGNTGCLDAPVQLDTVPPKLAIEMPTGILSPNGDGRNDDLAIPFSLDEFAHINIDIFRKGDASGSLVRSISSNEATGGGTMLWNGWDDADRVVADGSYELHVTVTDACANGTNTTLFADVDTTPPAALITYPTPSTVVGNIIEVRGTADDAHFSHYQLDAGMGEAPKSWTLIATKTAPVRNDVLGVWKTTDGEGLWTLRLIVFDAAGNQTESRVLVDLRNGMRYAVISDYAIFPRLFSPNGDGTSDASTVSWTLVNAARVHLAIRAANGAAIRTYDTVAAAAGTFTFAWDGRNDGGAAVADGVYRAAIAATLLNDETVSQTEDLSLVVDATLPVVNILSPGDGYGTEEDIVVSGTIEDLNLAEYTVLVSGPSGSAIIARGSVSRSEAIFGALAQVENGEYKIQATASDGAGNQTVRTALYSVDRTAPEVKITGPKEGDHFGSARSVIAVDGAITDQNLEGYVVRYGSGDAPASWTDLFSGEGAPASPRFAEWHVGAQDAVPDGLYTLSLVAKDKAGTTSEAKVRVVIDNTVPEAIITVPKEGDRITSPPDVRGSARDANLEDYILDLAEGRCPDALKWVVLKSGSAPVQNDVLAAWKALPPDGEYCLRLTVSDTAGNKAESTVGVLVDARPPEAPALSGWLKDRKTTAFAWPLIRNQDVVGYNLYRNGVKVNSEPIMEPPYSDYDLTGGVYTYTLKAVGSSTAESAASNEVTLTIDLTGPDARISAPADGTSVHGVVDVKGTAFSRKDFKQYRLATARSETPDQWTSLRLSPVSVSAGLLGAWDTAGVADGSYLIRLEAEDISGNVTEWRVTVTVDNTAPPAPILVSAIASGLTTTLFWQPSANTTDLAGYLVYRNDQLANAGVDLPVDIKPYLVAGTGYADSALPDGSHAYAVVAVDMAGNSSMPSNSLQVMIDEREPKATIVEPLHLARFESALSIEAETPDFDVASVLFQYKTVNGTWTDIGASVTLRPYTTIFDPAAIGLPYGDYYIQAVATDRSGKWDHAPIPVMIRYADLTPPVRPNGLLARTNGSQVTLTWSRTEESDLDGYYLYRTSNGSRVRISGGSMQKETTIYLDKNVPDGIYAYELTAVDLFSNESAPSQSAIARVYAPVIAQPESPVTDDPVLLLGSNAEPNTSVGIYADPSEGSAPLAVVDADGEGGFSADITLHDGMNTIVAQAVDVAGNASRWSVPVTVLYNEPPSAPADLQAAVSGNTVTLAWTANPEADVSGYNLYRNGRKANPETAVTEGEVNVSSINWDYYYWGVDVSGPLAFDGNSDTFWMSDYSWWDFTPQWLSITLPETKMIKGISVDWLDANTAAAAFKVQFFTGDAWVTAATVTGNQLTRNTISLSPPVSTAQIRLYITELAYPYADGIVSISEIRLTEAKLIDIPSFQDVALDDGVYQYSVTAVDGYGAESMPSQSVSAEVGDVVPPGQPQGLLAVPDGTRVLLTWVPNTEPDVATYRVFRSGPSGWILLGATPATDRTYRDTDLANGNYRYRITAVDAKNNESAPSEEATATVAVPLPDAPAGLHIQSLPEGGSLRIEWNPTPQAKYALYRGLQTGGPYERVNRAELTSTLYEDSGLTNGVEYFYVVTSVDGVGNESPYSDEASAVVVDTIAPSTPGIFFPARPGAPAQASRARIAITGIGEPGTTVHLYRNGSPAGETPALPSDEVTSYALEGIDESPALSPDGAILAYAKDGALWFKTLATGAEERAIEGAFHPVWSPDGTQIAYSFYEGYSGNERIAIMPLDSRDAAPVNTGASRQEYGAQWTADGAKVCVLSVAGNTMSVMLKDLTTGSLKSLLSASDLYDDRISPDGKYLAYVRWAGLQLLNVETMQSKSIDPDGGWDSFTWSPDGKRLTYTSYASGSSEVMIYDLSTGASASAGIADNAFRPSWSASGDELLYMVYNSAKGGYFLRIAGLAASRTARDLLGPLSSIGKIETSANGTILAVISRTVKLVDLAGSFEFASVALLDGSNEFNAACADKAGNESDRSASVAINFDAALTPDAAVVDEDILLLPAASIAGEQVAVSVPVRNPSGSPIEDVSVDLYLWNGAGNLEHLLSMLIPEIAPGSEEWVNVPWDSSGKAGQNRLVVVVDADDLIAERDESNNVAIHDFTVTDREGVALEVGADSLRYASDSPVAINASLWNSGRPTTAALETRIEDADGYPVVLFTAESVSVGYAEPLRRGYAWNTGTTLAGRYRVKAELKEGTVVLASSSADFTILPDVNIQASVTTNKAEYGPAEAVTGAVTIRNSGKNFIISAIRAVVNYLDAHGTALSTTEHNASNILPGTAVSFSAAWNTSTFPAGTYSVSVQVFQDGQPEAAASASFGIRPVPVITGSIKTAQPVTAFGSDATITYSLLNSGNADASGVAARLVLVDPETNAVLRTHEQTADLPRSAERSGTWIVSTAGLDFKSYTVLLQRTGPEGNGTLASASFAVKDMIAPVVTAVLPAANGSYRGTVAIEAAASDSGTGIDRVEYRIDSGVWRLLPPADPIRGKFAATWEPGITDNGAHAIAFRAFDKAGNSATTPLVAFEVQMDSTPPVTTAIIGTPKHEAGGSVFLAPSTAITLSAIDDISGVAGTEYRLDSGQYVAYTSPFTLSSEGTHTLGYRSRDNIGNLEQERVLSLVVDAAAPAIQLVVGEPVFIAADGTRYAKNSSPVTITATDAGSGVAAVSYRIDDGAWQEYAGAFKISEPGSHRIVAQASDRLGNGATIGPEAVIIDNMPPLSELSVGTPKYTAGDGSLYGSSSSVVTVSATDDLSGVALTEYRIDNGAWSRYSAFTVSTEGTHTISYRSRDQVTNLEADKSLALIIDNTAPKTTAAVSGSEYSAADGKLFVAGGSEIIFEATDASSGVARSEYRIDEKSWERYAGPVLLATEGTHSIGYRSIDNVENTEKDGSFVLTVDATPPVTTISATEPLLEGQVNAVSPSIFFTLSAADNLSGLRVTSYRIDDGAWQTYTGSFSLKDGLSGVHTVLFKSVDNVQNEETEQAITVNLVTMTISKKIAADPVVLVWFDGREKGDDSDCEDERGGHDDDDRENKGCADIKKDAACKREDNRDDEGRDRRELSSLDVLSNLLSSAGINYSIAKDEDDFAMKYRSGRYNTYMLVDVKEPFVGREIRDAVHYGDGLIFIKARHEVDPVLDELYGVKFTGRTTAENLTVSLLDSPLSTESALESSGKHVVAEVIDPNATVFATVLDKQTAYPSIVAREYGRGKVLLYTFNLPESPDQAKAAALLINSINYVRPAEFYPRPLGIVPIRISVNNSTEPVDIQIREFLPMGVSVDAIRPATPLIDDILTWEKSLQASETGTFRYSLRVDDRAADYLTRTEAWYRNGGEYRFYDRLDLMVKVEKSSGTLLRDVLYDLNTTTAAGKEDALAIFKALDDLRSVNESAGDRKTAEQNIIAILNAIDEVKKSTPAKWRIRLQLDELLKVWGRKWFELSE